MKATRLFFLMSGCAAFMLGQLALSGQVTSSNQSSESTANTVSGHSQDAERATPANAGNFKKM